MISIAAAFIALVIPFGDGPQRPITLDFGVYGSVGADLSESLAGGFATPFGYVYDRYSASRNPYLHGEELLHIAQWEALGPAFPLAYLATGGDPFEPYNPIRWQPFPAAERGGGTSPDALAFMWQPDERRSPQWRITFGPAGSSVSFMPSYAGLIAAGVEAAREARRAVR